MLFRQFFDSVSCTYTYLLAPGEGGEALIAMLPDHEFALPGQLVADASVSAVDHALAPSPRLTVTCELLLLEDG